MCRLERELLWSGKTKEGVVYKGPLYDKVGEGIKEVPDEESADFGASSRGKRDEGYSIRGDEQDGYETKGEDGDGVRKKGSDSEWGFFNDGHCGGHRLEPLNV